MAIVDIEGMDSQILPSAHEAIDTGYLTHSGIIISSISGSIASVAWVGSGEIVLSIDGVVPRTAQDIIDIVTRDKDFEMTLAWETTRTVTMSPSQGKVGIMIGYKDLSIDKDKKIQYTGLDAITMGARETLATTRLTLGFLSRMVVWLFAPKNEQEHTEAKTMLAWPIGLGSTFVSIVENSVPISIILVMVALLSINLGVINILPFPALDGGRIVTTTLYSLFSYIPNGWSYFFKVEWIIHTIWFFILLGFMLYVSGLDISRFF